MKNLKFYSIAITAMIILSCKKTDLSNEIANGDILAKQKQDQRENSFNPIIADQILVLETFSGYNFSTTPLPSTELAAQSVVSPLMYNSVQYFYTAGFSATDLTDEFGSLNNYQIAYVAFAMQVLDVEIKAGGIPGCNSNNLVVKCLVSSLLPCSILEYFQGNVRDQLTQLGFITVYNALPFSAKRAILKEISARSLRFFGGGALGLAFFAYDFSQCLINGGNIVNPNDGDVQEGTVPRNDVEDAFAPLAFPVNYGNYIFYTKYYTHIGPYLGTSLSYVPMPSTYIYFNSADQRYYQDALFTKVLPDGFYVTEDDMSNLSHRFREVADGKVVYVGSIFNLDYYRPLEIFDPTSHLPFF